MREKTAGISFGSKPRKPSPIQFGTERRRRPTLVHPADIGGLFRLTCVAAFPMLALDWLMADLGNSKRVLARFR